MTKETFKKIIDTYQAVEDEVLRLDNEFGINIWNSSNENFYNKYNYIIRKLFEAIFGNNNADLIEDYLFGDRLLDFDKLWEVLNGN